MDSRPRQASLISPAAMPGLRRAFAAALLVLYPTSLALAQAAIDPNVAPRAAALEREGERHMAIDLLGRYLATAPDDGRAWLQLGRFYLHDARDWHAHGHGGEPDGLLYLDFAATALEQSIRPHMPAYVLELGENLLASCPAGGVLLTGNELEALSVWYGSMERPSLDVLPIRPDLYATDSLYRERMARAMGVNPALPVQRALGDVAPRRTLCVSPSTDSAAVPALSWQPFRLVRISRPAGAGPEAMSITELLKAARQSSSPWVMDVRGVYDRAAAHNLLLCSSLLLLFGDTPPPACRP